MSTRQQIMALRKNIDKLNDEHLEIIYMIMKAYIDEYDYDNPSKEQWLEGLEKIVDEFYKSLEDTYAQTSKTLNKIYKRVKSYNLDNLEDLTYHADGIDFSQRIAKHWDQAEFSLKSRVDKKDVLKALLYHYTVIIETESRNVEETVKKNKKPIPEDGQYVIQVIEGCGNECGHDCIEYNGIYPEDEEIPWPPYHPSCTGVAYYDITDDPYEIEEAGLEEDDIDDNI